MRKKFFFIALMSIALLSSCSSERRALHQMRNLTERIEAAGEYYTAEQWERALEKYQAIDEKIDQQKLTPEQAKEYGELKGRCVAKFAKSKVERVVESAARYINQGIGILKGIFEGITQ